LKNVAATNQSLPLMQSCGGVKKEKPTKKENKEMQSLPPHKQALPAKTVQSIQKLLSCGFTLMA